LDECSCSILVILNQGLGWDLPKDTVVSFAALVIAWVLGESYVDGKRVSKGKG